MSEDGETVPPYAPPPYEGAERRADAVERLTGVIGLFDSSVTVGAFMRRHPRLDINSEITQLGLVAGTAHAVRYPAGRAREEATAPVPDGVKFRAWAVTEMVELLLEIGRITPGHRADPFTTVEATADALVSGDDRDGVLASEALDTAFAVLQSTWASEPSVRAWVGKQIGRGRSLARLAAAVRSIDALLSQHEMLQENDNAAGSTGRH